MARRIIRAARSRVRLRRGRRADAAALDRLERRCFATDRLSLRQYRRHVASPTARVIVAESGAGLVGAAVLLLRRGSARARLYSIAVDPSARGQGLGARLLARAEAESRRAGATALRLEVRARDRRARGLYERAGYRLIGYRPGYYQDGADALRYERALRASPCAARVAPPLVSCAVRPSQKMRCG